ncbi:MAG TPA: hypothetical protein VMU57_12625 [Edaphobacter sp.]|uniref:hypothetical protein n=1 Tax=Edaphobacter sp. TaxID=1934404 RepID=UPI002CF28D88|nr:hypothetical protein [Edaphobacter sp.]HUZ95746.1 hypothetical protein [Edaphobacter sp.]
MANQLAKSSADCQKPLWDGRAFGLSPQRQVIASRLRAILRTCPNQLGPFLADVTEESRGRFNKSDVAAIEAHLVANLDKKDVIPVLRVLTGVISVLNKVYQKSIPSPTRLDRLTKDPNLLPKNLPKVQLRVTAWAQAEGRWLAQNSKFGAHPNGSSPVRWEMVIASSALRCGLLSVKRVVAFARALADPQKHFGCTLSRGYADLGVMTHGEAEEVVRWYPNSQLLLLISRVSPILVEAALTCCSRSEATASTRDRRLAQVIFDGIVAEFRLQGVGSDLQPRSLGDFVGTVAQYLRSDLPSALVDYASGRVFGPSLLPGSAARVNNEPTVYTPLRLSRPAVKESDELPDLSEAYAPYSAEKGTTGHRLNWMSRLRAAFSKTDSGKMLQAIGSIERSRNTTPSGRQLCSLAKMLLTGPAYSGYTWSFSGTKCCIMTIARRFALQQGDADPARYPKRVLEERYRIALSVAGENSISPQGLRRTVAWALRQFHNHLHDKYEAPNIDFDDVLPVTSGPDNADAHVLSIDEIFKALEYIEASRTRKWNKLYRIVARGQIVLDFLGSFRRAEGFGLMPDDILPGPFSEVTVRGNDNRDLKTENAYRRVLLGILAHPFAELLNPVNELFLQAKQLGTDLSCGISDDVIVPIIHEALRAATGTRECHLNTLRHSAAHWMFMRLMLSDLDQVPDLFPHLEKTTSWLKASGEFRSLLLHNGLSMNDHAWAVATTLGHSNPDNVTLRYYTHCLDTLLALFLESRTKFGALASPHELRRASGLPRSTAFEWLPGSEEKCECSKVDASATDSRLSRVTLLQPGKEFAIRVFSERLGLTIRAHGKSAPLPAVVPSWAKDTYDILWMSSELGLPAERLAAVMKLDQHAIHAILSNADSVLRNRGFQNSSDKAQSMPASGEDIAEAPIVPRPPKISFDSESFKAWAAGIESHVRKSSNTAAISLAHMVSNILPKTAQVVFAGAPPPDLMKFCLDIYEAFGFHREGLYAITCDGTTNARPTEQWLRKRGISRRVTAINQLGGGLLDLNPPWVVVGPKSVVKHQAEAIWFLIRMAAIRFSGFGSITH